MKIQTLLLTASVLISGQAYSAQSTNAPYEDALKSFYMEDLNAAVIYLKNALKNNPNHLPSRILMAEILIAQGDGAGAEIQLEFAEQGQADNKKVLPLLLEAYLLQSKFDLVIEKAIPMMGSPKLSSKILVLKGRALFGKNNLLLALAEYKNAFELNNKNADAVLGMAQIAYKRNQYDEALDFINQTLTLAPLNTNAFQMKASIYQIKGDVVAAEQAITEAIHLNPKHFPALLTRAGIYIEQQQFSQALTDVEVILTDIPNEPRANYLKAVATRALGMDKEFSKTASHLDVVLTGMPDDVMKANPIYYYLAGLVNFNQGEYLKANEDLRDYIEIVADDVRALKLLAKTEIALNEYFSAKNDLIKARLLSPDDIETWALLGQAYHLTGEVEKALLYYKDVVKALPDSANALADLAQLEQDMGQLKEAIKHFTQARKLAPKNAGIALALAYSYQLAKQPQAALEIIDQLITQDDSNSYLYQQRGILLGLTEQHKKAKQSFEQAYQLNNNNIEALVHLARIDMLEGNSQSARARLEQKLASEPDHPMLLVELGNTYQKQSEIKQAKSYYEKAYDLNRDSSLAVTKVLEVYAAEQNFANAIEIASEFLSRHNADGQLHLKLAEFYLADKQFERAMNSYQLAVKHSANKSASLMTMARGQLQMRDRPGAVSSLQKAIAWNEQALEAYFSLIDIFTESKNEQQAFKVIEQLSEKLKFPALIQALKADVYLNVGKYQEAEKLYQQSLALDNSQKATLGLSQTYVKQHKLSEAIALLTKWHHQQPQNVVMAIALADNLIAAEQFEQAATLYQQQLQTSGSLPVLLNNAAQVNILLSKHQLALQYAEQAYARVPGNVAIMDTMAWALTNNNQPEKALAIYREALVIESDNAEIKYHLAVNLVMLERKMEAVRYLKEAIESAQQFTELKAAEQLLAKLLS